MAALVLVGCNSGASAARKAEVDALSFAVERLREADNSAKRPHLLELERVACSQPDVCEAKRVCVAAYTKHVLALDGVAAAKRALGLDVSKAKAERIALLVEAAQKELEQARRAVARCNELTAALRRAR